MSRNTLNREVDELTKEIEKLTIITTRLRQRLERVQYQLNQEEEETFSVGDLVSITNHYRGQYGRRGRVYKITRTFVYFPDSEGQIYSRAPKNIRRITH